MNPNRTPLIEAGQLYLNDSLNEYLIVTRNNRGQVYYEGSGFRGSCEDYTFLEKFQPVDPEDVDEVEINYLLSLCPEGTQAAIGIIGEDE